MEIEKLFTYHPPKDDQPQRYEQIRDGAKAFAHTIMELTPASREQSVAIRKLREAVMYANAAIAINE